jgi:cephalosporin hydroxylase
VRFLDGLSTDPKIGEQLRAEGAFDIAYLDSSHSYDGTIAELGLLFGPNGWLGERGLLVAHDVAAEAADFDPTGAGGVPRALAEWVSNNVDAYQCFVLAPPLWPCGCGVGLVSRRELPLARPIEAT